MVSGSRRLTPGDWKMSILSGTALGDYGHPVFQRDGFTCVYCGFDGNRFTQWRQLTVHHLRPMTAGGTSDMENLVTACHFCNSATSRMKFSPDQTSDEILASKKERTKSRLKEFHCLWSEQVIPRDSALTPEHGGAYLPLPLALDLKAMEMTDDQLIQVSADNRDLQFERTAKGELVILPPTGGETSLRESESYGQLWLWSRENKAGVAFGPTAGFRLPNGAILAPDASWVLSERWESLPEGERKTFPPVCPDFVLEIRSQSDILATLQRKMEEYIANGTRLGWLVDPVQRRVHVYTPGCPVDVLDNPATVSGDPVLQGFELNLSEIW